MSVAEDVREMTAAETTTDSAQAPAEEETAEETASAPAETAPETAEEERIEEAPEEPAGEKSEDKPAPVNLGFLEIDSMAMAMVKECVAKESSRYSLNRIAVWAADGILRIASTDGRRMAVIEVKPEEGDMPFPEMKTILWDPKAISARSQALRYKNTDRLTFDSPRPDEIDDKGSFPPVYDVIPQNAERKVCVISDAGSVYMSFRDGLHCGLAFDFLKGYAKIAKKYSETVVFKQPEEAKDGSPMVWETSLQDGARLFLIQMPIHIVDYDEAKPAAPAEEAAPETAETETAEETGAETETAPETETADGAQIAGAPDDMTEETAEETAREEMSEEAPAPALAA